MKSLTVLSLLASLVPLTLAQSQSVSLFRALTLNNTHFLLQSNPFIPSGISQTCQAFYVQLDANTTVSSCLKPLISATSAFGVNATAATITNSIISSTLGNICSNTCDPTIVDAQLALFYQSCQPELTSSKVSGVLLTYDVLYAAVPFLQAVCQKDKSGNYCVLNMTSPSTSTTKRSSELDRRDGTQQPFVPNAVQYGKDNLLFLGLQPNLSSVQLCTDCTRNVVNVYTAQLNRIPYASGLSSSSLFSGESALYAAINSKCGPSFLSGEVKAAGALSTGAAPRAVDATFALVGSAIVAVAAGAIAVL